MQQFISVQVAHRPRMSGRARFSVWCAAFALGLAAPVVVAADFAPFRVGAIELTPDYNTKVTPTGNVLLPNGEVESADLLLFKPRVTAFLAGDRHHFSSTVEVQNGLYSAVGDASYVDWKVENIARFGFDGKRNLRFRTESFSTHDGAGSAVVPDNDRDPARFLTSTFETGYEQTLWNARGQLALDAGSFSKEYVDTAQRPDLQNHVSNQLGSSFRYRVLPGAHLQLQYRASEIDYLKMPIGSSVGTAADRQEIFTYVGASWEPPTAIAGKLKIVSGYKQTVNSAVAANSAVDTSSWETNVRWQPFAASTVTFAADRTFRSNANAVSLGSTSSYRYNWEHRWDDQLKTTLAGSYSHNVVGATNRVDEGLGVKFRLDYVYSAWVDMFVAFGHDHYISGGVLGFSQQTLRLGVAASLDRFFGR